MPFLPFQRIRITTHLDTDQVVQRLRERVGAKRMQNSVRVDKNLFSGKVGSESFALELLNDYRNSWSPEIRGRIMSRESGSEVVISMKAHNYVIAFTGLFILFGLLLLAVEINDLFSGEEFDWSAVLFVIIPYGLSWVGFNIDSSKAVKGLQKLIKGQVKKV